MSNSVRPHKGQPTRLLHPWDSPGKNTGVGCHFLLQCMKVKSEGEVAQSCPTLSDPMDYSLPGSSVRYPGSIPGQRIKILLHATTHCCLREIRYSQIINLTYIQKTHGVAEGRTRLSDFTFTFHFHALEKEMATHSSVLAWRIPGTGSLVGCCLRGHIESDTTEAT